MALDQLLSDNDVAELFGVDRLTIWAWTRNNPKFPKPIRSGSRFTRWRASEIAAFMDALVEERDEREAKHKPKPEPSSSGKVPPWQRGAA